jgi:hypothetical protein
MGSATLRLTIIGPRFSLTPLSPHVVSTCTHGDRSCTRLASHRLLSRLTADVQLLCDAHTIEWAQEHGHQVTTAKLDESAA